MAVEEQRPTDQRPSDLMTAKDAALLFSSIDKKVDGFSDRLDRIEEDIEDILRGVIRIDQGLAATRYDRLEIELREIDIKKQEAERNLESLKETLALKQEAKDKTADTNERIKVGAVTVFTDLEKKAQERRAALINDIKMTALKAAVGVAAAGLTGTIFAFIWWLVMLYANRGAP